VTLNNGSGACFRIWSLFYFCVDCCFGISLELIADGANTYYFHTAGHHAVTPLFAITTLSICVGIYFLCNSIMRMELIDRGRYNILALIVGVVIAIIPVIAVKCGLELIYAVFLILLGIIIIITHIGYACPLAKKTFFGRFL